MIDKNKCKKCGSIYLYAFMLDGVCYQCIQKEVPQLRTRIATLEADCRVMAGAVPMYESCKTCVVAKESYEYEKCLQCRLCSGFDSTNYTPTEAVAIAKKWGKG